MDSRCEELCKQGDKLFEQRRVLIPYWQETAENFFPEEALFTTTNILGQDFASNLTTSFPLLVRRDLGDAFSSMQRPTETDWFKMGTNREDREDNAAKRWMEWAGQSQRRAMYDPIAQFTKATKKGDHFYATFGQAVLSLQMNRNADALLFRHWHLRDVAWCENDEGVIDTVHRDWCNVTVRDLNRLMKGNIAPQLKKFLEKDPYHKVKCRHIVMPAEHYQTGTGPGPGKRWNQPFVSIYIDRDNSFVMVEEPEIDPVYIIPRWTCYTGSQYAFSPAVTAALPDARLLQSIALTLLEAGEKAVNPPMVLNKEAIRGEVDISAGSMIWEEANYDENRESVRLLVNDKSGIPLGMEMVQDLREQQRAAWYLDRLGLPAPDRTMTAFEANERVQEYVRRILPIVEPTEAEYNAQLCDRAFGRCQAGGMFGSIDDRPQSLRGGADIKFKFESPFRRALEEAKGQLFGAGVTLIEAGVALDPAVAAIPNAVVAMRDALSGIGWGAKWMNSEEDADAINAQKAQAQQAMQMAGTVAAAGQAAEALGKGGTAIREAVAA